MDKKFEGIADVSYLGISLACRSIDLHYPPDRMHAGATGDRTLVRNHEPGIIVVMLVLESEGLGELSRKMLANQGRALTGTLVIVAKDGTHTFEDACVLHGPNEHGRCEFNIARD